MTGPYVLTFAYILDLAIGDPRQIPHPVRIMGRAIESLESYLRKMFKDEGGKRKGGIALVVATVCTVFLISFIIEKTILTYGRSQFSEYLSSIIFIYLVSTTLATRELIESAASVTDALVNENITDARERLALIVGRDTDGLDEKDISKATIETLAENASDGIIAPIFYFVIGGFPLAMTYKAINTMDSMVGYKNDRYREFGWAAARLDDIANYIPARITGFLIVAAIFILSLIRRIKHVVYIRSIRSNGLNSLICLNGLKAFKVMLRDGKKHSSPNSGIPEAAMAGALGIRLGGPSTYGGVVIEKPYIGEERTKNKEQRTKTEDDHYLTASKKAIMLTKITSFLGLLSALAVIGLWN